MKQIRTLQLTKEDNHKLQTIMEYLIESMVDFKVDYKSDGDSVIEFVCEDWLYECMLEEVPRIHREKRLRA